MKLSRRLKLAAGIGLGTIVAVTASSMIVSCSNDDNSSTQGSANSLIPSNAIAKMNSNLAKFESLLRDEAVGDGATLTNYDSKV